jgi:hypothetical protein
VGVGGSGKQSLSRLAGHICGYATMTIVISGNYGLNNFRCVGWNATRRVLLGSCRQR